MTTTHKHYHVSVTGIALKSVWQIPRFMWHTRNSMTAARQAAGVVHVRGTYRKGVHHTLTIWEEVANMMRYRQAGAHHEAMVLSKEIGTYVKVYGYSTTSISSEDADDDDVVPSWEDALELWEHKGRVVFRQRTASLDHKSHNTRWILSYVLVGCCTLGAALTFGCGSVGESVHSLSTW
jgi:hypothetical protein